MTDEERKALSVGHAHITGRAMRDHWGPIIDRIADEIADPRDARIAELEAIVDDLLRRFEPWSPHDFTAVERARAALGDKTDD